MLRRLVAGLLAFALFPVVFSVLALWQPDIDYDSFRTECNSVTAGGSNGFLFDQGGGPIDASVVDGQSAYGAAREQAVEDGLDLYFIQRSLDKDCVDRRQTVLVSMVVVATLGLVFLVVAAHPLRAGSTASGRASPGSTDAPPSAPLDQRRRP